VAWPGLALVAALLLGLVLVGIGQVKGILSTSTTGYKGVSFNKRNNSCEAYIQRKGTKIHLGNVDSEIEAALAYDPGLTHHFSLGFLGLS